MGAKSFQQLRRPGRPLDGFVSSNAASIRSGAPCSPPDLLISLLEISGRGQRRAASTSRAFELFGHATEHGVEAHRLPEQPRGLVELVHAELRALGLNLTRPR